MKKLLLVLLIFLNDECWAQGLDFAGLLRPPGPVKKTLRYSGTYYPKADFSGSPKKTSVYNENINLGLPFFKGKKNDFTLNARYHRLELMPNQAQVPDLYDAQVGLSHSYTTDSGKIWMNSIQFGSSSDFLFKDNTVDTLNINIIYKIKKSEKVSYLYMLNYSNNRAFLNNVPLPGFAYFYTPNSQFRLIIGAPFFLIHWEFMPKFNLNLFSLLPWTYRFSLSYTLFGPAQFYTGLDFSQQTYLKHGRANKKERLFLDEKKLFLGARMPLNNYMLTDLDLGFATNRKFFYSEKYKLRPLNPIRLRNQFYVKASLSLAI